MPITVNFSEAVTGGASLTADVDGTPLTFAGEIASQPLTNGVLHKLHWYVAGPTGSTYTIAITSPTSILFNHMHTIDASGIDYGIHYFTP